MAEQKEIQKVWDEKMEKTKTLTNLITYIDKRTKEKIGGVINYDIDFEIDAQAKKLQREVREFEEKTIPLFRSIRKQYRKLQDNIWKLEVLDAFKRGGGEWYCEGCEASYDFQDQLPVDVELVFDEKNRELNVENDLFCKDCIND